ncbi:uncharacterized protein LOC131650577 [Vicia villosa]|uniref:uncharacterized protein LOC131650577 n=1 Tax=Vicia villosa TaxID=3911 RepID=UPI00273C2192|nr:uncharacterized protein LOC131650577 [Vicia villosa]
MGLWYPKRANCDLVGYFDSNFVGFILDRKSTSSTFGYSLVSWHSKKQAIVELFIVEEEYITASSCCAQIVWIKQHLSDYGVNLEIAKVLIKGDAVKQYNLLWRYSAELRKVNSGFTTSCRSFVGVDGCHLKTKYGGTLLTVVGRDPNDQYYPLDFGVCETETKESWSWFLTLLLEDIGQEKRWVFIYDQQKVFKFGGGTQIRDLMMAAPNATYIQAWNVKMKQLKEINVKALEWLSNIPTKAWCKHAFTFYPKCVVLMNNVSEAFNSTILVAGDKPILTMCEWVRIYLMNKNSSLREKVDRWKHRIMPRPRLRSEKFMASFSYENRKGSGKKLKVHFDLPEDEDYPIDHVKMKDSSSSISSQSSLDSDDSDKDRENLEESNNGGYGSPVWSFQGGSVTHSPPIQLMSSNHNSGYDPNRIPSSAFGPKPASPMEWSVASNESLFSLHFGNNSFSREQFLAFRKSGELSRNSDLNGTSPTLATVQVQEVNHSNDNNEVDNERTSLSSDCSHDSTDTSDKVTNITSKIDDTRTSNVEEITLDKTHDNHSKDAEVPNEEPKNYANNVSYRSVESDISNRSFQFPILTAEGVRTSSETVESEKKEKNEKQQQDPIENPHSPKSETKPKPRVRGWRCCSCFSCSPCY